MITHRKEDIVLSGNYDKTISHTTEKPQVSKRSKYRVHPDDRILVEVWIDTENDEVRVLREGCLFSQGQAPCQGNAMEPCNGKYSLCNNHTKSLCTDEVGMLSYQLNDSTSGRYRKEWAYFARESWATRSYIDTHSVVFDPMQNTRTYDPHRKQQLTLRCLLKSWSLGKYDDELAIRLINMPDLPFTMIQEEQMKTLGEINSDLVDAFLNGYVQNSKRGIWERKPEELKEESKPEDEPLDEENN